jgi:hypothetical protein
MKKKLRNIERLSRKLDRKRWLRKKRLPSIGKSSKRLRKIKRFKNIEMSFRISKGKRKRLEKSLNIQPNSKRFKLKRKSRSKLPSIVMFSCKYSKKKLGLRDFKFKRAIKQLQKKCKNKLKLKNHFKVLSQKATNLKLQDSELSVLEKPEKPKKLLLKLLSNKLKPNKLINKLKSLRIVKGKLKLKLLYLLKKKKI